GNNLYVFHHDTPHEVKTVTKGFRITITFDLVVSPLDYQDKIEGMVEDIKNLGAKRFGFLTTHMSFGKDQPLKGDDARFVSSMEKLGYTFERMDVTGFTNSYNYGFHSQLINTNLWEQFMKMNCYFNDMYYLEKVNHATRSIRGLDRKDFPEV